MAHSLVLGKGLLAAAFWFSSFSTRGDFRTLFCRVSELYIAGGGGGGSSVLLA